LCYVLFGVAQCGVECGRILDVYVVLKIAVSKSAMCTPILGTLDIGRCGRVLVVEKRCSWPPLVLFSRWIEWGMSGLLRFENLDRGGSRCLIGVIRKGAVRE
jgi:hypothetical protein